jgi:hypothetical protein
VNPSYEAFRIGSLTLPKHQRLPSVAAKTRHVDLVAEHIALPLHSPEFGIRYWRNPAQSAVVNMPVATVDEDHLPAASEHEIRLSRQVASVQTIAVTERMDETADAHFRLRILRPDPLHVFPSLGWRKDVDHGLRILRGVEFLRERKQASEFALCRGILFFR